MYRIGKEEIEEISKVINSGQLFRVGDPAAGHLGEVEKFEEEWAAKIGTKYALQMCGGGTAALVCCMAGLGIGPGDEVIVPAYTWLATATSVLTVGAIPVLADVDETLALDPNEIDRLMTPNVKAVIPVHMSGRPANLEAIVAKAKQYGIKVIEDSCQMVGGSYKGKRTGSWGDAGAFSFNFFKIISSGEGGALVTNNEAVYERAYVYHDSGAAFRPKAAELGIPIFVSQQYRADEFHGAIMRMQMQKLDGILADLRKNARAIEAAVAAGGKVKVAPSNDIDGDCGVVAAFSFCCEEKARKFAEAAGGMLPIDSGKHVYTNWDCLLEKNIGHHPAMNPFFFEANKGLRMEFGAEVCAKTLQLLKQVVYIGISPDWTDAELKDRITTCQKAAESI
jgi:dTDP-4-amino-4,6-dideoxygalactose transaminase